eukprot:TRINITY_DN17534_c0_g1_i1.p1 TRINITY_DN17534_c0_g1~~TRINITY_DN17534_c0_g1_i1.p1  ORF type:complete len:814 (+),score=145.83 TRINITY_DN17534_c0_g1_i1:297-2444(+)
MTRAKSDTAISSPAPVPTPPSRKHKGLSGKKTPKKKTDEGARHFPPVPELITYIFPGGGKKGIIPLHEKESFRDLSERVCLEKGLPFANCVFTTEHGGITHLDIPISALKSNVINIFFESGEPHSTQSTKTTVVEDKSRFVLVYFPNKDMKTIHVGHLKEPIKSILEKSCKERGLSLDHFLVEDYQGSELDLEMPINQYVGNLIRLQPKGISPRSNRAHAMIVPSPVKEPKLSLGVVRSFSYTLLQSKGIKTTNQIYATIEIEGDNNPFVSPPIIMESEDKYWGFLHRVSNPPMTTLTVKIFQVKSKSSSKRKTHKKIKSTETPKDTTKPKEEKDKKKDKCIGTYHTKMHDLQTGAIVTEWVQLSGPRDASIRIKYILNETDVLPEQYYKDFVDYLIDPSMKLISILNKVTTTLEWPEVSKVLMHILHNGNRWQSYLEQVISEEVEKCSDEGVLFRGNSLGIASLRFYLEYLGKVYMCSTLSSPIKVILTTKNSCELKVDPKSFEENFATLDMHIKRIMSFILTSESTFSAGAKYIFHHLRKKAEEKFGPLAGMTAITGFLFLRFLVPAIRDPQAYGLWQTELDPIDKANLNSVAQLIQKIANLSKFRKEDLYACFNPYIDEIQEPFKKFINDISSIPPELPKPKDIQLNSIIAYDSACLIHFLDQHKDYLEKEENDPDVITLRTILNPINKLILMNKTDHLDPNKDDSKKKRKS